MVSRSVGKQVRTPGKAAGRAFYSPGPPLGSFTKEMQAVVVSVGKQEPSRAPIRELREGFGEPISSEPTPSHRPWASTRARPRADLDAAKRSYSGSRYCPSACTMEPCRQASAMASCAVRLEHSVSSMTCWRSWLYRACRPRSVRALVTWSCSTFLRVTAAWEGARPAAEKHNVCGSSWSNRGSGGAA